MLNYTPVRSASLATILVIEADARCRDAITDALADETYLLLAAASVDEAFTVLAQNSVDVVLANQSLVGDPGSNFLRYLQGQCPTTIRILLVDAHEAVVAKRNVRDGTVHHFLPLPWPPGELALVIYNSLVQRSFLPPESEGILPIAAPTLVPTSSRIPPGG